jgi:signal transduction histidine kinase
VGDSSAEGAFAAVVADHEQTRDPLGFRLGDLARLRLAELALARDQAEGERLLRRDVEALLAGTWIIGNGAEAAVARRALDLVAGRASSEWVAQARGTLEDRSAQLFWAERLLPELDTLAARGLFRSSEVRFAYQLSDRAVWATTSIDDGQYVFGLELGSIVAEARILAARAAGPDTDVVVKVLGPGEAPPEALLSRQPLTAWMPGWTIAVEARDPDGLAQRRTEERLRGSGIVLVSVGMIVVGATLSARLVQRELDSARDKSDFAAHVSHELRSPITQIRLKAEALQLGLATTDEQVTRHYDVIAREAERLSRLVDNVLDFSAIERGRKRYTLRPGDLGGTVLRAVESARVAMETRTMRIELELPEDLPPIWHDADAIAQVMHNLLSNAAKYGQEAAWIGVTVRATDDGVEVGVADRGIGIAAEEQPHVFEQYWRSSDPQARRRKGTGIGLTIVKYIMEAHGGRVSLASSPGAGTTFTLHFPLRAPQGASERAGA